MICITSNQPVNSINRLDTGIGQNSNTPDLSESGLKSQKAGHLLPYTLGDVLQFTCFSGDYTTIKTDSPSGSVNYEIEFTKCSDDDGRNYSVVNIGAQTWMAENLAYLPKVSSPAEESDRSPYLYIYDYRGNDLATAKSSRNYSTYGVLYNWPAAVLLCPSGWHLPSDAEWDVLRQTTGTEPGRKLKENGTVHWISPNEGASNASGLTILPGGIRQEGHAFGSLGSAARFWSSTDCEDSIALGLSLDSGNDTVVMVYRRKSAGFSVRCVKNQDNPAVLPAVNTYTVTGITTITAVGGGNVVPGYSEERVIERGICWSTARNPTTADNKISAGSGLGVFRCDITGLSANTLYWAKAYATNSAGTGYGRELSFMTLDGGIFTDSRDSKSYRFVKIGSQYWMAENLAYLPEVSPPSVMSGSVPHYYVYGYEGSSPGAARAATNFSTYGVLYNWPASLSACPEGWHLPTLAEFANLISFTGGDTIAGYKMKSTGGWNTNAGENGNGDDSFGFTALPGGDLEGAGAFLNLGNYGSFWTSGADGGSNAWLWLLDNFNAGAFLHSYPRSIGISVRCLKN